MSAISRLGRAETAALIVETLAKHEIDVVLVGGSESISSDRIASLETRAGTIRLLNPTDTVKDRLLWWYLEGDRQCWEQALDIAENHTIEWQDLEDWHNAEGYAARFADFVSAAH